MPYSSIKELPAGAKKLPTHAQKIYLRVFNDVLSRGGSESDAFAQAYAAAKKGIKNKSEMETLVNHDLYITKANLDSDGKMVFAATASDTDKDSYREEMSLQLYKSFIDKVNTGINTPIYISLAHYPRLDGKGEVGIVTDLYIDGNKLKAKGYFNENPLGISVYNAVRKDRRENVAPDKRVRISIGFYDYMHQHENGVIWESKSGKPCVQCGMGIGGKVYLDGVLEHLAVTRVPVNRRTEIVAKSEGEDMTTRVEDALSIVEDENIVKDVEKAYRETVNKSDAGLIEKSEDASVKVAEVLGGFTREQLLDLFKKLEDDGTITSDAVSEMVNGVLNDVGKSEAKDEDTMDCPDGDEECMKKKKMMMDKKKMKSDAVEETPEVEKCEMEMAEMYKPFGGATSFEDAAKYMDAAKLESNAYMAYSMFGALAQNILSNTETELSDRLGSMQKLLGEFKDMLKPEKLMQLSEAEDTIMEKTGVSEIDVKPLVDRLDQLEARINQLQEQRTASAETPVVEEKSTATESTPVSPELESIVTTFETELKSAISNTGENRLAALQQVINKAGENLLQLHNDLAVKESPVVENSLAQSNEVLRALENKVTASEERINNQINTLSSQIAELGRFIQAQAAGRVDVAQPVAKPIPQMKSIVMPVGVPQAPKPMSIMDIATKTVIGR